MFPIWLTWGLLVAVQSTNEALGQLDLASPYGGTMYGERVAFALACLAFVIFVFITFAKTPARIVGAAAAASAVVAALLATPELGRTAYPAVMAWGQLMMTVQLLPWWAGFIEAKGRGMAVVVLLMQGIALVIFVYAQMTIGLTPAPAGEPGSALHYLEQQALDIGWAILGTLLLAVASLWRRS